MRNNLKQTAQLFWYAKTVALVIERICKMNTYNKNIISM